MINTVDKSGWINARRELLAAEKSLQTARDDDGAIYHTYSCYSRGLDTLNPVYQLLDLVPKGRDEAELPYPMDWVRRNDAY
jgi:predicted dithiol-disulfide oxidoreductase (DUF899 family)